MGSGESRTAKEWARVEERRRPHFLPPFFFTTLFFLCVVHIILKPGTSNEFQCMRTNADTCSYSSAVLVLVRVHTG